MNWWLWTGVTAFCTATVCAEVYFTRRGTRSRAARFGAYTDALALTVGVATVVLIQLIAYRSAADAIGVWTSAVLWGLSMAEAAHLLRLSRRPTGGANR